MEFGLSEIVLKGDYPRTIPEMFGLIWVSGFRGVDLTDAIKAHMAFGEVSKKSRHEIL